MRVKGWLKMFPTQSFRLEAEEKSAAYTFYFKRDALNACLKLARTVSKTARGPKAIGCRRSIRVPQRS